VVLVSTDDVVHSVRIAHCQGNIGQRTAVPTRLMYLQQYVPLFACHCIH
jgi:hypothetical protein